ncbi:MAG: FapA family protein [Agarilytica sp.]
MQTLVVSDSLSKNSVGDDTEVSHVNYQLVLDSDSRLLRAVVTQSEETLEINLKSVKARLEAEGYSQIEVDDATLVGLVRKVKNKELGDVELGELQAGVGLTLEYEKQTRSLYAVLAESSNAPPLSFGFIKELLDKQGYGKFEVNNNDISGILVKAKQRQYGRYALGKKPEYTSLSFSLDEASGSLYADLSATEEETLVSRSSILDELKALGFADFFFQPNALDKLYNQVSKNERGRFIIGEKRDAQILISCDEEFMSARMTVSPPQGGRDLDENLLKLALDNEGIYAACCDQTALDKILKDKTAEDVEFAKGTEPVDGVDATFEALVQEVEYSKPKESKTGKIDLREVISFSLIEADTPIMRRTPAKPGENGRNVKGQVITALEADDSSFDEDLLGAIVSDKDSNLLVSTCKGHPVILAKGVKVDNSIVVNNVDMSTGNITYDGSVLVKGEVKAGMKIKVTGDIIVKGVVTKATLIAKNNITVECGIIGSDPAKDGDESPPAILKAGGDITAQYVNLAEVHAGRNIEIREYISHGNVEAKEHVLIGQKGGKGKVFGGVCYGRGGVYANEIGANGGVKTLVCAGTPPDQQKQFETLLTNHKNRETQAAQLSEMLEKYKKALTENPQDIGKAKKIEAIKKVLKELTGEIDKMATTIDKIQRHFKESKKAEVSIRKSTFPNATISINGAEFSIRQESKGGIFNKQGKDIRWNNYKAK